MKIFFLTSILLTLHLSVLPQGLESVIIYKNQDTIGGWDYYCKTLPEILINLEKDSDTLFFSAYGRGGIIDQKTIEVKYKGDVILKLAQAKWTGDSKRIIFKATRKSFKALSKYKTYNVFIKSLQFKDEPDNHIFDLKIK